jgi:glyoxylase-like metal-dependent hydrolase (beta-lactamase superfamily II)
MTSETTLTYQVYVAPIIAMAGKDIPPGQSRATWSPISATLISGRHDAVLVDPLMTVEQGMAVADWVSTTGKNLTTVYVTHGHGDHWFGLGAVRERFPGVRAVATPAVVESMRRWSAPEVLRTFWQPRFPGQIPEDNPVADPLDGPSFELEGRQLDAVNVGHTDTDDTTVLHVPDLGLVVAGDAAYNGVHQYLAEAGSQGGRDWLAALDIIEAAKPASTSATSTGSTRKPPRPRNSTGRCWRLTRTGSIPAHCGCRRSRQRPEQEREPVLRRLVAGEGQHLGAIEPVFVIHEPDHRLRFDLARKEIP